MNNITFIIILGITWFIGLVGSFVLSYFYNKKHFIENNSDTVINTQYEFGGPLMTIPILNFVLFIWFLIFLLFEKDDS